MAKRVKNLENFPKEKVYNPNCAMPTAEECIGFNESRSIIGELTVLEPLNQKQKDIIHDELGDIFAKHEKIVDTFGGNIIPVDHTDELFLDILDYICQRFGTSAVGTGKQMDRHFLINELDKKFGCQCGSGTNKFGNNPHFDDQMSIASVVDFIIKLSPSLGTKEVDVEKIAQVLVDHEMKLQRDAHGQSYHDSIGLKSGMCNCSYCRNAGLQAIVISAFLRGSNE